MSERNKNNYNQSLIQYPNSVLVDWPVVSTELRVWRLGATKGPSCVSLEWGCKPRNQQVYHNMLPWGDSHSIYQANGSTPTHAGILTTRSTHTVARASQEQPPPGTASVHSNILLQTSSRKISGSVNSLTSTLTLRSKQLIFNFAVKMALIWRQMKTKINDQH